MLIIVGIVLRSGGSWVQLHFPQHRIRVTHYALVIPNTWGPSLRGWKLLCSNDGAEWTRVDTREHQENPFGRNAPGVKTFELATPAECSFVRIELRRLGSNLLRVQGFEVFGSILG
jgi:hypothetical protein